MERVLDRRVEFDEKSRGYNIRGLLDSTTPRSYTWRCNLWLDQGTEGACVGFSWAHEIAAKPKEFKDLDYRYAYELYRIARVLDQWPGENYSGTSVIAGAKAVKMAGMLKEYRWAFSTKDALAAISRHGPAVLGVNWYEGMWEPDDKGLLHVTGDVVGGHAILANGVSVKNKTVTLHNSWGQDWGKNGEAKISWDDFDKLLKADGEVCIPVLR